MRLSKCDIRPLSLRSEYPSYFIYIATDILPHIVRRIPLRAVYHGVHCAFVYGDIKGWILWVGTSCVVNSPFEVWVFCTHLVDNNLREIDGDLLDISQLVKICWNCLDIWINGPAFPSHCLAPYTIPTAQVYNPCVRLRRRQFFDQKWLKLIERSEPLMAWFVVVSIVPIFRMSELLQFLLLHYRSVAKNTPPLEIYIYI